MRILSVSMVSVFLLTVANPASGADAGWEKVTQLGVGQKIMVLDSDSRALSGTFLSASDETLSLQVKNAPVAIPRSKVTRVTLRERSRRPRNAAIGAAAGAAAGAGLGTLVCFACPGATRAGIVASGALVFGALGAGIGALIPSYPTIYKRK